MLLYGQQLFQQIYQPSILMISSLATVKIGDTAQTMGMLP